MNGILRWVGVALAMLAAMTVVGGCETPSESNKRELRVDSDYAEPMRVYLDGVEVMHLSRNGSGSHEVSAGVHEAKLVTDSGRQLWRQSIDLSTGEYSRLKVEADGSVVGSGGYTDGGPKSEYDDSYHVGPDTDRKPELWVQNELTAPVRALLDGTEVFVAAAGETRTVRTTKGRHQVGLVDPSGRVLHDQAVDFRNGQYLLFTLVPGGPVVAAGGPLY